MEHESLFVCIGFFHICYVMFRLTYIWFHIFCDLCARVMRMRRSQCTSIVCAAFTADAAAEDAVVCYYYFWYTFALQEWEDGEFNLTIICVCFIVYQIMIRYILNTCTLLECIDVIIKHLWESKTITTIDQLVVYLTNRSGDCMRDDAWTLHHFRQKIYILLYYFFVILLLTTPSWYDVSKSYNI